jgi:hypothetical protein
MKNNTHLNIKIHLNDISDLYAQTEIDPFNQEEIYNTGIEYIYEELKKKSLREKVTTTIYLPKDSFDDSTHQTIKHSLKKYCNHMIERNNVDLINLRWEAIKAFQTGLLFLAACLFLSAVFKQTTFLPSFLKIFLTEGLLIVGWVSMWHPIELSLYEWWPYKRENKIFKTIRDMELIITND